MMQNEAGAKRNLYYTNDHEWIDFQGTVAYVGVCTFKLTGFKEIQNIKLKVVNGTKVPGDVLAIIKYKDYLIDVCMPVTGKVTAVNESLVNGDKNMLLQHAEGNAWLFKISPSQPYDRTGLIPPREYRMKGKKK